MNRHIADASINEVFIIAWNTIVENIETCREKWRLLAEGDDVLKAYRAKDLLAITEEPWKIREIDSNVVIRVLDYITVHKSGKIVITFYDGTEIEYS